MSSKDERYIWIFAVYNNDEEPVIIGTEQECKEYIGDCSNHQFWYSVRTGGRINKTYRVYKIERVKRYEKKCTKCGEVKHINEFSTRRNKKGIIIHKATCKKCDAKKAVEWRKKQKRM